MVVGRYYFVLDDLTVWSKFDENFFLSPSYDSFDLIWALRALHNNEKQGRSHQWSTRPVHSPADS